jgi:hypothetical protein
MRIHTIGRPIPALAGALAATLLLGCGDTEPLAPGDARGAVYAGAPYAAPTNVAAVAIAGDRIRVTWQDNTNNETRFEVFRSFSSAPSSTSQLQVVGANVTMLEVGGLSAYSDYCFQVRAVRDKGGAIALSPFSAAVCARTMSLPETPTAARITSVAAASSATIRVRWVSQVVVGLQSRLDRSLDGGATWETVTTLGGRDENWHYDEGVPEERAICYRVVDFNATATAAPSNTACTILPAAPTELTATPVDASSIDLAWRDVSAVEDGYGVSAVFVSCWEDPDYGQYCDLEEWAVAVLPANATSYRTTRSDAHYWRVHSLKDGAWSNFATVAAPAAAPQATP